MRASSSYTDQITIAEKRARAASLEMTAQRLRQEADELERKLLAQGRKSLSQLMSATG
jgi:hypothetical protein